MLLVGALWHRSASAVVALLLPVVVWLNLFGGLLGDKSHPGSDLTVAEQNVNANNPDPAGTARDLAASGAEVLALVELTPQATGTYEKELAKAYSYHTVQGTIGLWSKLPLSDTQPIDIMDYGPLADSVPVDKKMASNRALRTAVTVGHGPVTVYVVHPGSVRVNLKAGFWTASRNIGVEALGKAIAADSSKRVVLLGDLNGTMDDRAFADITAQMQSAQDAAGDGFGFTWPANVPGGADRPDPGPRRGIEELVGASGQRQRPPAGSGRNQLVSTVQAGTPPTANRSCLLLTGLLTNASDTSSRRRTGLVQQGAYPAQQRVLGERLLQQRRADEPLLCQVPVGVPGHVKHPAGWPDVPQLCDEL